MKLFEDTTATERYYNRSLKIRMAALDWLRKLADQADRKKGVPYESIEDLGADCAQWVHRGGWDRKPGSTEAGARWAKQYLRASGYFASDPENPSQFVVVWRDGYARAEVETMLARYKRRRS